MKQLSEKFLMYRLTILYAGLFTVNSLCASIMLSFLNIDWSDLGTTSKFLVFIGILQSWTGTILAFINRTVARLDNHEPIIQKDDLNLVTTSVKPKPVP